MPALVNQALTMRPIVQILITLTLMFPLMSVAASTTPEKLARKLAANVHTGQKGKFEIEGASSAGVHVTVFGNHGFKPLGASATQELKTFVNDMGTSLCTSKYDRKAIDSGVTVRVNMMGRYTRSVDAYLKIDQSYCKANT